MRSRTQVTTPTDKDVEIGKHSSIADGGKTLYSHLEINMTEFQKLGINLLQGPAILVLGIYPNAVGHNDLVLCKDLFLVLV